MKKIIPLNAKEQFEKLKTKAQEIIPEDLFFKKLEHSFQMQTPLKVKFGIDPSYPNIHLGHSILLQKLKQFQDFGHSVYFLIGDFTSQIGDPTGRSKMRPRLTKKEVIENAKTYKSQVEKILDVNKIKIIFNSEWWEKMTVSVFIEMLSKSTVQILSKRDDFSKRLKKEDPLFMHEFIYPIIQAYDSVHLKCDLELGGTDQTFNLLMGRGFQKAYGSNEPQVIFTLPLLEGLDGVNKMSKSFKNVIPINDTPTDMFGKMMSISDDLMVSYYKRLSQRNEAEIKEIIKALKSKTFHPMEAKKNLAQEITALYHSKEKAKIERVQFEERFSKRKLPKNIPVFKTHQNKLSILKLLKEELKWFDSKSEIRRLIKQDGLKINEKTYKEESFDLKTGKEYIVQAGKLKIIKIITR